MYRLLLHSTVESLLVFVPSGEDLQGVTYFFGQKQMKKE